MRNLILILGGTFLLQGVVISLTIYSAAKYSKFNNTVIAKPGEYPTWQQYFDFNVECPNCKARNWNSEHGYDYWLIKCQECRRGYIVRTEYDSPRTLKLRIEQGPTVGPEK